MLVTNCLLKYDIEGKMEERIEMTERRIRRRKQLLDKRQVKTGYCELKMEALDRSLWRTPSRRGYGPLVRQTANLKNKPPTSNYTECLFFNFVLPCIIV